MQKYAIAAALSLALAIPALAASTKQCQVVAQKPDGTTMKMVGSGGRRREGDPKPRRMQQLNKDSTRT